MWILALKATAILAAAHLAALAMRRRSAAERHWIWVLATVGVLALPLLEQVTPQVAVLPAPMAIAAAPAVPVADIPAPVAPKPDFAPRLWLWGAAAVLGYYSLGLYLLHHRFHDSRPAASPLPVPVPQRVRVLESPRCASPMTWGWLRPVILLPAEARHWPVDRLRIVLLHELQHIRRADFATQWLAHFACALYWWNPLIWLAARQMQREREKACDDSVLRLGATGPEYATHLLDVARGHSPAAALGMGSYLESRIRSALDTGVARHGLRRRVLTASAALVLLALLPLAGTRIAAQTAASGRLQGSVIDSSGAAVPQTTILVIAPGTGRKEIVRSGDDGRYAVPVLPAGQYTVEARRPGFALLVREGVSIAAGQSVDLDLTLQVGRISETIEVVGKRPLQPATAAPAGTPRRIRVGGNVQATKLLRMVRPAYPEHLQQQGVEGTVLLDGVIGVSGTLLSLTPSNALVHPELTQAALDAVKQWHYQPTLLNGQPVEIITTITVNFRLAPQ